MKVWRWMKFVVTPRVYPHRWQDRLFTGHKRWEIFGLDIVVYGANAMHWALNVRWRGEWYCAHPRTRTFGGYWPAYFYVSPDATPQSARFMIGRDE